MTGTPAPDAGDPARAIVTAVMAGGQLYHFTCEDGCRRIAETGVVQPARQPLLGGVELSWWTDLEIPFRDALGLTSVFLSCDRTAHRFAALKPAGITYWPKFRRTLPEVTRPGIVEMEWADGAMPVHWWVATTPVPVVET